MIKRGRDRATAEGGGVAVGTRVRREAKPFFDDADGAVGGDHEKKGESLSSSVSLVCLKLIVPDLLFSLGFRPLPSSYPHPMYRSQHKLGDLVLHTRSLPCRSSCATTALFFSLRSCPLEIRIFLCSSSTSSGPAYRSGRYFTAKHFRAKEVKTRGTKEKSEKGETRLA